MRPSHLMNTSDISNTLNSTSDIQTNTSNSEENVANESEKYEEVLSLLRQYKDSSDPSFAEKAIELAKEWFKVDQKSCLDCMQHGYELYFPTIAVKKEHITALSFFLSTSKQLFEKYANNILKYNDKLEELGILLLSDKAAEEQLSSTILSKEKVMDLIFARLNLPVWCLDFRIIIDFIINNYVNAFASQLIEWVPKYFRTGYFDISHYIALMNSSSPELQKVTHDAFVQYLNAPNTKRYECDLKKEIVIKLYKTDPNKYSDLRDECYQRWIKEENELDKKMAYIFDLLENSVVIRSQFLAVKMLAEILNVDKTLVFPTSLFDTKHDAEHTIVCSENYFKSLEKFHELLVKLFLRAKANPKLYVH